MSTRILLLALLAASRTNALQRPLSTGSEQVLQKDDALLLAVSDSAKSQSATNSSTHPPLAAKATKVADGTAVSALEQHPPKAFKQKLKNATQDNGWHHTALKRQHPAGEGKDVKQHKVQHIRLLKDQGFWWLMLAFIGLIAVVVVSMEVKAEKPEDGARDEDSAGSEKAPESEQQSESSSIVPKSISTASIKPPTVWDTFVKLQFCVIGLNGSMLLWGVAQEYVMTNVYTDSHGHGEPWPSALFLVCCNRVGSVIFSAMLLALSGSSFSFTGFHWSALPATSNMLASWCQYSSLLHISFPLLTTAKSAKLLPVLAINAFRNKKQTMLDYAEGIVITCALVVFGLETDGQTPDGTSFSAQGFGVLLLCGLMLFDSLTPHLQDELFQRNTKLTVMQATFSMAFFAAIACTTVLLFTGGLFTSIAFLQRHPESALHIAVLSLCSTLTQFLISYTIKHFGPVTFAIIATTRQVISVCLSSVLFKHTIPSLASIAAAMVFGTVLMRSLGKLPGLTSRGVNEREDRSVVEPHDVAGLLFPICPTWVTHFLANSSRYWRLCVCALAIHVPLCFWALAQEFMFAHTFGGSLFPSVLFIIAMNRTFSVLLAVCVLRYREVPCFIPDSRWTLLPAGTNLLATACQYEALYWIRFPQQTIIKTLKVIPVMLGGRLLKNRSYSWLDYLEALLLTGLTAFFVWGFERGKEDLVSDAGLLPGLIFMAGYILADALPSNFEDYIYQTAALDPAQMLLGTELSAGVVTWALVLATGQLGSSLHFLVQYPEAFLNIVSLALASACGSYACTVTIRLFSPAVFTLLMMSRQLFSLVLSVVFFQHRVDAISCLCLVAVALLILTSSMRQAAREC
mmetsp:Transcript_51587/g.122746  ORF Transcript_51587/g.122746 Transcript_51587/m.122746 type:complete len:856 (+) Transcript_51587:143-2710(+)